MFMDVCKKFKKLGRTKLSGNAHATCLVGPKAVKPSKGYCFAGTAQQPRKETQEGLTS